MLPLNVLRIWGLGLLSWCVLGSGLFLLYQAYKEANAPESVAASRSERDNTFSDLRPGERSAARDEQTNPPGADTTAGGEGTAVPLDSSNLRAPIGNVSQPPRRHIYRYLLPGLVLTLLSCVGSWPINFALSNWSSSGGAEGRDMVPPPTPQKTLLVDRPDGTRLNVEIYGEPTRPTLLLTHGWSLNISTWKYVLGDLAKHYRVVVWDLPGLGKSKAPSDNNYKLTKMAADLEAVLKATATKLPTVLAGHSIGGMITQTFCRLYPQHLNTTVQGVVLVHTTYTNPLRTAFGHSLWTAIESWVIVPLCHLTIWLAPVAWLSNWKSYLDGSLQSSTRWTSFTGKQSRAQLDHGALLAAQAWPGVVARGNLAMLEFNENHTLPKIDVPVLVISSAHDRMTLPEASDHIEQLLPLGSQSRYDSGHLGFWELPADFCRLVESFMDKIVAPKSAVNAAISASGISANAVKH